MEREERIARNEAAYRQVNEAIQAGRPDHDPPSHGFLCECGTLGCNELVEVTPPQYEAVRAHPRRFLMLHGHEIPDVETVVERHDAYLVVEKVDGAAEVADELDPRDR